MNRLLTLPCRRFARAFAGHVGRTARKGAAGQGTVSRDEKPVVIPFELLKSRHMAIQVKVNDKGRTGSSSTRARRRI